MYSENDFYIPRHKYEYVYWLEEQYPKNKQGQLINWNKLPLKQLRAIYIGVRKNENAHVSSKESFRLRSSKKQDSIIFGNETRKISSGSPMVQGKETQVCFDFST